MDFEFAAFVTLGAIALHGFRLAEAQIGERVAVVGLGLVGLLAGQIAAAAGCQPFGIDLDPQRVALAASLGLQAVERDQAVDTAQAFTANRGFDVVLICADTSSADPVELAGVIARDRARLVAIGAVGEDLPRKLYYEKELSFINSRSYGPGRYDSGYEEGSRDYPIGYVRWTEGRNLEAVVELMAQGKLDVRPLVTHRFPIEKAPAVYELITGKRNEPFLGVLLTYPDGPASPTGAKVQFSAVRTASSQVRLGVLGAGNFANVVLLPAIKKQKGVELVGIASVGGLHAEHTGKKFGFAYAASDEADILNDPQINTIAILTRHDTHAGLVMKSLQAGKHVFVEKPLAITQAQLDEITALLTRTEGRPPLLMVGFNRRFAPLAIRLKEFLSRRTEPLHMHYRVNAGSLPLNHWTQDPAVGGGRIIGEGCHFIDFLAFLAGGAPSCVNALALPDNGKYREDNVSMTFTFPDGTLGVVDYLANGDKAFPKERVEIFCAGRVAVLDDFRSLQLFQDGKRSLVKSALRQDKGHNGEWRAFVKAIREGGGPPIPYEQLFGVTKATFAAMELLRVGQKIVIV